MAVMLVVMVVMAVPVIVVMSVPCRTGGRPDIDMNGRHTGSQHARRVDLVPDAQVAEGRAQVVNGQARVQQRAEQHVAGGAGETIEVHHPRHGRILDSLIDR
jgi:hypothetical protein